MSTPITVEKVATLSGHQGSIYSLQQHPEQPSTVISTGGDGMVVAWDLNHLPDGLLTAKVPTNVFSSLIIPSKNELLLGQMQGGIHVLDMGTRMEVRHLALHEKGVYDLLLLHNNILLASGGDGKVSLWDVGNYNLIKTLSISDQSIRSLAKSPDGSTIAIGCSDNKIYLIDSKSFEIIQILTNHKNSVFCLCYSPTGNYLISGSRDAHIIIWKTGKKYELYRSIPAHLFTVNSIAYHPGGLYFATASRDKTIKIWDAATFELLKVIDHDRLKGHLNSVNDLIWSPFNHWLISGSDDRSLMIWAIKHN